MSDSWRNSWIGLAAQSSWTAASVARTKFMRHLPAGGGGLEQKVGSSKSLSNQAGKRAYYSAGKIVKFSTHHEMEYNGLEAILKRAFGAVSSVQQGATGAYKHSFTLVNTRPMATIERCMDSKSLVWPACKNNGWYLEGNLFEPIKGSFEWIGRDEDTLASPSSPSFADQLLVIPSISASTLMKLGGNSFQIQSWKVDGAEPLREEGWFIGNTMTIKEPGRTGERTVTGEVTMEFDGTDSNIVALYEAYQDGTESSFQALYVDALIASTYFYTWDLQCSRIRLTGKPPDVGDGIVMLNLTFEAYDDEDGTPAAATLDLTNTTVSVT